MSYQFAKFLGWLSLRLSSAGQKYLGRFLGYMVWMVIAPKRKQVAVANIMATLYVSRAEASKIAKKSVARFGKMVVDMFTYPCLTRESIGQILRIHGAENLDEALALGRGVVMASGHCGNWELMGTGLAFYGYPMIAVAKKQEQNSGFEKFLCEYRVMGGGKILYTTDVRDIVRVLRQNQIPLIFFDHDVLPNGVWIDFLGRQTSTPPGAAVLARIADSPIVPAFVTEAPDGTHDLYIYPPLWVDKQENKEDAVKETMQNLSHLLEAHIRKHPHEWFWLHNRWRPLKTNRDQGK
ncbi:MAG: lipid biosynthesis acyltransferase [Firmicutes bacterium]|nr:lipid biosynthesis acyltransferase [Bacillota bacterium]